MAIVEMIGGGVLSAFFQVLFDRIASQTFLDFFRNREFDDTLLDRLRTALLIVHAVLNDAEEKQITNPSVKQWMDELRDAAYHTEDVLDEISILIRSKAQQAQRNWENKLIRVTSRLEVLAKQRDILGLKESIGGKSSPRLPTTSLLSDDVKGRDTDKEKILNFMFSRNREEETSVIAIVGLGGIGKTTLAQFVYNDSRVKTHFSMRAWVYVSEDFDVFKITKAIYESITSRHCSFTDLDVLQVKLKEKLTRKRFLLILDDVWNENFIHWDVLRIPLKVGNRGSRIIVTTRSQSVAGTMHPILVHTLHPLIDEDSLSLFEKHAFRAENQPPHPVLRKIGKEIVNKCDGLPLAVKTLGGLLQYEREVKEWIKVLNSDIWDLPINKSFLLPVLRMSYCYLPSNLKPCFAYCSIFPKGYKFRKDELILLWMAEGFLQQPRSKKRMEELGDEYFRELLSRSFFQPSLDNLHFTMHDLINDLAQFTSGEFIFKFENAKPHTISEKARHVSYLRDKFNVNKRFEALLEPKFLRTFLPLSLPDSSGFSFIDKEVVKNLLPHLKYLRVFSLSHYEIDELPDLVHNLIHIHYLNLSHTKIKCLPKCTCDMLKLQTLILSRCVRLTELPKKLSELEDLRHLYVDHTKLKEMPTKFGRLRFLQTLTNFVVGRGSGSKICELGELSQLRGKLSISELQNVKVFVDAENAKLQEKCINELVLSWNTDAAQQTEADEAEVLKKLQPHEDLEKLTIKKYGGPSFPDWFGDVSFSNMTSLHLEDCENCLSLPSLGQLASLKELCIVGMKKLETPLTVSGAVFPSLQELVIEKCPELTGEIPSQFSSLKSIRIIGCRKLEFLAFDAPYGSLTHLFLTSSCDSLMSFRLDLFSNLEVLEIEDCRYLKFLVISDKFVGDLRLLKNIEFRDCHNLEIFPSRGLPAPFLASFTLLNCQSLAMLPEQMHQFLRALQTLIISYCPELESFLQGLGIDFQSLPAN